MNSKSVITFTIALLCVMCSGVARATNGTGDEDLGPLDPECAEGLYPGVEQNILQWKVSPIVVMDVVGSFFNYSWYVSNQFPPLIHIDRF
jgi:hypothetical protein